MKKTYSAPEMSFEQFKVEQNIAAGNCVPQIDESNVKGTFVVCDNPDHNGANSKEHTTTIFASANNCETVVNDVTESVSWGDGHTRTILQYFSYDATEQKYTYFNS